MKNAWLLLDNRMGSVGQARGVATKLEKEFIIIEKSIEYTPLAKLPNELKGRTLLGVKSSCKKNIANNFPDLVISASRRTAPIARWIKKHSKNTKIIQLVHPGNTGLKDFEAVFVPYHDKENRKNTKNTIYIHGAPHRINQQKLLEAKQIWQDKFANLPKPLTSVIIGGGDVFNKETTTDLCNQIKNIKQKIGGSILLTTSKRTLPITQDVILKELKGIPSYNFLWNSQSNEPSPLLGYLACSDNIIVTGDSVSMISESCGTGKPVYIYTTKSLKSKHLRFAKHLFDNNYAINLNNKDALNFAPTDTLDTATFVAQRIKELF